MKLSKKEQQEIRDKNDKLESIKPILKREFIGIDLVIDNIIESIRPFYIFPKSLKRPLVVNLWGLTGTGKTSMIDRIVDLLELRNIYSKFDVGEYASSSSDWKLKQDLSESTNNVDSKNLIFAFDEFQLGRTIDEKGMEQDKISLRPMWELIDHGCLYEFNHSYTSIFNIIKKLKSAIESGVKVENGYVTQNEHIYNSIMRGRSLRPCDYKICTHEIMQVDKLENDSVSDSNYGNVIDYEGLEVNRTEQPEQPTSSMQVIDADSTEGFYFSLESDGIKKFKTPKFIKYEFYSSFYDANPNFFNNEFNYKKHIELFNLPVDILFDMISKNFIMNSTLMIKRDFSQSLIFCVGNIDEAYTMAYSADPDADADLFYEHSTKITIPKMKNALSYRFRMEQIGRLGNNHIVYPALNKQSYRDIINIHFEKRMEHFDKAFGIKLEIDETFQDILYKESVFPSQGVRPVLSSFNTLVDSYVARLISDIIFKDPSTHTVKWKYSREEEKFKIKIIGDESENDIEYGVKLNIENLRDSDYSEDQSFTAVHEAGHAIVSIVKVNLVPKEVVSKSASVAEGFCRIEFPDQSTRDLSYKQIMVALGGIEAERYLFGDDMISTGSHSDLSKVTNLAVSMVKEFGMGEKVYQSRNSVDESNGFKVIDENNEKLITEIIENAQKEVANILKDNEEFFLELSYFLSNNSKIEKDELVKMTEKYNIEIKDKEHYYKFKDIIRQKMNTHNFEIPESFCSGKIHELSLNKEIINKKDND